jgi:hypothetical protein
MATFDEAVKKWTDHINEWYSLEATVDEVCNAFEGDYRDKVAHDGTSYVEMFFRDNNGSWTEYLDTADREGLADAVEHYRGNGPLPTYADLGGSLLNKAPRWMTVSGDGDINEAFKDG